MSQLRWTEYCKLVKSQPQHT
ncbi:hypothetical protein CO2235_150108 [Cupriavidus oxalaticus]|uniref:Uncharacterized protein n=1 Tax=Cupriavidus oxalaticus TaxID=96344 RepID=A0A976G8X5_9BURK|nr:hypothetical protein CO2235_150108 [Cupriavidus oxalaticus]